VNVSADGWHRIARMRLAAGTRLGPYEIVSALGAGGMGEVYKARDTRLDRTAAIKILPEAMAGHPDLRERMQREARVVSSLNHPHICTLYDVGSHDGTDYFVMEYVEGETLADRLKKGALPLETALTYAIEIAGALNQAHRQGIVHRDLKPGNLMLTKSGTKLLDFGLAKVREAATSAGERETALPTRELTTQGMILGTFQYMAPEQLEGKEADARSDIFAFGAVLYEMVTGRHAFTGATQASLDRVDSQGVSAGDRSRGPWHEERCAGGAGARDPDMSGEGPGCAVAIRWGPGARTEVDRGRPRHRNTRCADHRRRMARLGDGGADGRDRGGRVVDALA
jgi:serine/threonine protein kinase